MRRRRSHACWDHIIVAPLWPLHGINLGTLLRTCDAAGACLAVPRKRWIPEALERGNTLRRPSCVHWVADPLDWLAKQRSGGTQIIGVELADEAIRLADLPMARQRTVVVLGHEQYGIPDEALEYLDAAVEIPMIGTGASLNVAVALPRRGPDVMLRPSRHITARDWSPQRRSDRYDENRRFDADQVAGVAGEQR